jgi:hypothetical protein
MLEESLGNNSEVDLLEPFVSMDVGSDDITHLLHLKGGLEWQPFHGTLYLHNVGFARFASIMQLLRLHCLSKVQGNFLCHAANKAMHTSLRH